LELTKKGVPHYHLVVWLPKGVTLPKPDKRGWWPHGSTRIEWARNAVGYIAKYASKGTEGHAFPRGARLNGSGGLSIQARIERRFWTLPLYVRLAFDTIVDIRKTPGGFLVKDTGEFIESMFQFIGVTQGKVLFKLKEQYQ
jgi:hypothetical protein